MTCIYCNKNKVYQDSACRDCLFDSMIASSAEENEGIATKFETALMMMEINSKVERKIKRSIISHVLLTANAKKQWEEESKK